MEPKFMQLPRAVMVGSDTIREINSLISETKLKGMVMVISDKNTFKIAGKEIADTVSKEYDLVTEVVDGASIENVNFIVNQARKIKTDFFIGVGGGSVIDVAKMAAQETSKEFISVPTAASHDGIASSRASIKHEHGSVSTPAIAPLGVLADTKVIMGAPKRLLSAGCGDIISKYTAVKDWELAHEIKGEYVSEYATALSLMTAKIIINSSEKIIEGTENGVRKVVKALISSGVAMSIAGSSRPGSGSEHKFSHALDRISPKSGLHGEQCGLGSIIMMYLHGGDWRSIRTTLQSVGAPTTASELGIDDNIILEAMMEAKKIRPHRYTIIEHINYSRRMAREVLKKTGVIG